MPARRPAALLLLVALTACGTPASTDDALRPAAGGCPTGAGAPGSVVDYVPFVRHDGLTYVRSGPPAAAVPQEQVGRQVGSVRCALSDGPHEPGRSPQDGDSGFLPPGTPLHVLEGAAPTIRIVAREQDGWHVYDVQDDPQGRRGADLLDLRDVVRVSLVESERGTDVVRALTDPAQVARVVEAVRGAPLHDAGAQDEGVRGPQWFVRFDLASGPAVQRAWYPEGRWLFPRVMSPQALHDALLP